MARIRTIKPEFFTSEDIVSLTPLSRLFYVSLWCESDREGRLSWKPGTLKMRYLPGDSCEVVELAQELINAGLILIYEVDGKKYAEIPSFKSHQVINNREQESVIPPRVPDASQRVKAEGRKGKEGREGNTRGAELFERFWNAYPRKVSKEDARRAFDKRKPDEGLVSEMLAALAIQVNSQSWVKDDGQYIPHAATWINAGRWMDEVRSDQSAPNIFAGAI